MRRCILLFLFLLPLTASAATYSWTDPAGTVNFTDDIGAVPRQFRKKALQQAAGDSTAPSSAPVAASPESSTVPPAKETKPAPPPAAAVDTQVTPSTRFGDRTAAEWQTQFKTVRAELAAIQQKQEALKQEAGDGKKMLTRSQVDDINTRNKQLHEEYEATRLRFNALVEQANKVGLPPEFGQ